MSARTTRRLTARRTLAERVRLELARNWQLYVLVLPALIYILLFHYGPMYGVQIAFKKFSSTKGIWDSRWVGLRNFERFFAGYQSKQVIWNTIYLNLLALITSFPVPIVLSLLLNQITGKRYQKVVQTITYAPHFISTVVMVGMLNLFLSPSSGIFNRLVMALGGEAQLFMGNPRWFRTVYIVSDIWQHTGWNMILFIATLSNVSPELYESSCIDGANRLQQMRYIDLPVLVPVVIVLLILRMGSIMGSGFEKVYAMQNDMNLGVSEVISTYTYKVGMIQSDFSYSTAVGLFNSVVNFVMLTLVNFIAGKLSGSSLW